MVGIVVDVVPHHELIEREQSEESLFHDIPSGHIAYGIAYGADNSFDVDTIVIDGKRIERDEIDIELLFQEFKDGDVDDGVFIARTYKIITVRFADDVDWHQNEGGKARLLAAVVLIPFQHAQGNEERIGTILFKGITRTAVNIL